MQTLLLVLTDVESGEKQRELLDSSCLLQAMCRDYYVLQFMDRSVDTSPIAPALANFFDNVLDQSISQLNFKACTNPPQSEIAALETFPS